MKRLYFRCKAFVSEVSSQIAALPDWLRHAILIGIASGLSYAGDHWLPALHGKTGWEALAFAGLSALLAVCTPLIQAYGFGTSPDA